MIRTVFVHEFVTGGGMAGGPLPPSWAAEGRAMRLALAEDFAAIDGVRVRMTLDASLPDEPGPWEVVRVDPGEERGAFARLATESDHTLCVAPETGAVLEGRARWIEAAGGRSLGSSPDAIALCADKLRLAEHLAAQGIDTPPSICVDLARGLPRAHPYPAVLKPIDGAGSLDTYHVESPDHWPPGSPGRTRAIAMPRALLQPFVPGRAMSAAFLILPPDGPLLVGVADQVVDRAGGRFTYRGGVAPSPLDRDDALDEGPLLASVRSVPGLLGWVGVDFLWDRETRRLAILEINPRVTTSYVGFRLAERPGISSWIAAEWMRGVVDPGSSPRPPRRDRAASLTPVSFSADGRTDREGVAT